MKPAGMGDVETTLVVKLQLPEQDNALSAQPPQQHDAQPAEE